ncbi:MULTISPECIES: hypothetical protein [Mycolicibacterium]|uniref:hypothetical protein n=1 Tax=Mycolicibacterium monacense TaxID=85693 RepID=UPI0007EAEF95|nr:hypothetical protein [Mycolicibacterium monacense]OBB67143.1 hypothetical protein A6B34_20910 [Mycolicibacterium monacense]OBF52215.1 hypothetical protein A5778_13740 [Mycolicibacterium monacense]
MTTISRVIAAVVLALGVAVGAAGPAQAEQQVLQGIYTYTQADGLSGEWTIFPSCVPTVGDLREPLYLPVACRLHVTSFEGVQGGDAVLTNGVWAYDTTIADGITCSDGSPLQVIEIYEFNTETMSGTRTNTHAPGCNGELPATMIKTPFTLAYKTELPIPVDKYPLICEPGGLRRCF